MSEKIPEQQKTGGVNKGRRGFLKTAGIAAGVFAGGAIGGALERNISERIKSAEPPELSLLQKTTETNPLQELVNKRHAQLLRCIEAGNVECIQFAYNRIAENEQELTFVMNRIANMTTGLSHSDQTPEEALHASIENEIYFLEERRKTLVAIIRSFRDPLERFKDKEKKEKQETSAQETKAREA